MTALNPYKFLYFTLLLTNTLCDESTTEDTIKLLETYRNYINSSHNLDKSDRTMMKAWTSDFLLQVVNITTHYRLDMTRHKEHSFDSNKANSKWRECLDLHQNEVSAPETSYYADERKCVKEANEELEEKKHSVTQTEKEIRKWRKSYRYLWNQCNKNNPGDDVTAGECLVEYMQKDNYHITFQRLILLKLNSMSELYAQVLASLRRVELCLRSALSTNLAGVRRAMDNLNRCYTIKTVEE